MNDAVGSIASVTSVTSETSVSLVACLTCKRHRQAIMPKLNRSLIISILADIKELICVANEIYSWLGRIEHLSWKFPTKMAVDVNAMEIVELHEGSAGELYVLLLEVAYDRIQFVLRLIVEFMDNYPFVEDFFREVSSVRRPNYMSLASIIRLIWNRLKTIPDSIASNSKRKGIDQERFVGKMSRSCQASSCTERCESCSLAGDAVLRMINALEAVFEENKLISAAAAEREHSKGDIYGRTQWAVMSRLTTAIGMDVKTVFGMMRENDLKGESAKRNYESIVETLQTELSRKRSELAVLQAESARSLARIQNVTAEMDKLRQSHSIIEERNVEIARDLENTRLKMSRLAEANALLQSQSGTLAESKLELESSVSGLREQMIETRDACRETERDLRRSLTELQRKNDTLAFEYRQKIHALEQEITLNVRSSTNDDRAIRNPDKKDSRSALSDRPSANGEDAALIVDADPEVDMMRQLVANREKIEMLSRQNERLSRTLQRLREHRLTAARTAAANGFGK